MSIIVPGNEVALSPFATVTIGGGLFSTDSFLQALHDADCVYSYEVEGILRNFSFHPSAAEVCVPVYIITAFDLGYKRPPMFKNMVQKAVSLGFKPCTTEIALLTRLTYSHPSQREEITVVMPSEYPRTDVGDSGAPMSGARRLILSLEGSLSSKCLHAVTEHQPHYRCSLREKWLFAA